MHSTAFRSGLSLGLIFLLGSFVAVMPSTGWAQQRWLSKRQARHLIKTVARRENRFYQPGVGFDGRTGMTFDGQNISFKTGQLVKTRNWSAPSKESLHVALLVKAVSGDKIARTLMAPHPRMPWRAKGRALSVLEQKISTYERFNREFPGFGGFLPWYQVERGRIAPIPATRSKGSDGKVHHNEGWESLVPSLDNGQLAWSLYYAANTLKKLGHHKLAARYQAHFDLMRDNVVRIFYDPQARKMRAEARLLKGSSVSPEHNVYSINKKNPYFLTDPYEGLMLCHFADLFGKWQATPRGKEAIWTTPRRQPATYVTKPDPKRGTPARRITIVKSWVGSSHEEWGEAVLPFTDLPIARKLSVNAQRSRTAYSAQNKIPGMFASTHQPISRTAAPGYLSLLGFRSKGATLERAVSSTVVTPYAAFPLALAPGGKRVFATWLKTMVSAPRMFGPYGMGESCSIKGDKMAPCLTWDGKALPMFAWMGGIRTEVRALLKRDGLYRPFLRRVAADFKNFRGIPIEGTDAPIMAPSASIPRGMAGFQRQSLSTRLGLHAGPR